MCLNPSTPKYDPPVTLEAPLPEETPDVVEDPNDISTGKYRSKANRRGTQMFRTQKDIVGKPEPYRPRPRRYTPGPNGELPPSAIQNTLIGSAGSGAGNQFKNRGGLETKSIAPAKKKSVSANPGLTISRT